MSAMFSMTGVTKPDLDVDAMADLSNAYAEAQSALSAAYAEARGAVQHVLAGNDGPAADAFEASEVGPGSVADHLEDLAAAATRTQAAYTTAASAGGGATVAMQALANNRMSQFWQAWLKGAPRAVLTTLVQVTRIELLKLESNGSQRVTEAFAGLNLPSEMNVTGSDWNGNLDTAEGTDGKTIEEQWQELYDEDPELVQEILQKMADDYADANGIPRIELDFTAPPGGALGDYSSSTNTVRINPSILDDPTTAINTTIHEMEHSRQYDGMDGFRWPWQDERAGMSREDAKRWRELNEGYVRDKGDDPTTSENEGYWPRPIEVGARDAGRDYVNNLTVEEFEEYR